MVLAIGCELNVRYEHELDTVVIRFSKFFHVFDHNSIPICVSDTSTFKKDEELINISSLLCYCSIVGNPLICATGAEPECHGMTLMPMSMNLNNSQGFDFFFL